uniref:Uncharacterized protein n=1 Tax=Romanomermis culicivorax TaxID=13658 RepID=A0A915KPK6_ROMCU
MGSVEKSIQIINNNDFRSVVIVLYSVCDFTSLELAAQFLKASKKLLTKDNTFVFLVANKIDLERQRIIKTF